MNNLHSSSFKASSAEQKALRQKLRAESAALKAELKKQLAAQKAAQKKALQDNVLVQAALAKKKKSRRRKQLFILLMILLLLLQKCDCAGILPIEKMPTATANRPQKNFPAPGELKDQRLPRSPLRGRVDKSKRPQMPLKAPLPPSWLAQFRMQVAARSPRLADCFTGNEQPGAMRWSAKVDAKSGRIFEAEIEPVFRGAALTQAQRDCLVQELTEGRYYLTEKNEDALPRRVSLIFEF